MHNGLMCCNRSGNGQGKNFSARRVTKRLHGEKKIRQIFFPGLFHSRLERKLFQTNKKCMHEELVAGIYLCLIVGYHYKATAVDLPIIIPSHKCNIEQAMPLALQSV